MQSSCFCCSYLWVMDDSILQYYNFEDNMFMSGNRNFVKSPQNGLAIKPFEKAHLNHAATDPRTIGAVTISVQDNLSNLDHWGWKGYSDQHNERIQEAILNFFGSGIVIANHPAMSCKRDWFCVLLRKISSRGYISPLLELQFLVTRTWNKLQKSRRLWVDKQLWRYADMSIQTFWTQTPFLNLQPHSNNLLGCRSPLWSHLVELRINGKSIENLMMRSRKGGFDRWRASEQYLVNLVSETF